MNLIIIMIVCTWPVRNPFKIYFRFVACSIAREKKKRNEKSETMKSFIAQNGTKFLFHKLMLTKKKKKTAWYWQSQFYASKWRVFEWNCNSTDAHRTRSRIQQKNQKYSTDERRSAYMTMCDRVRNTVYGAERTWFMWAHTNRVGLSRLLRHSLMNRWLRCTLLLRSRSWPKFQLNRYWNTPARRSTHEYQLII